MKKRHKILAALLASATIVLSGCSLQDISNLKSEAAAVISTEDKTVPEDTAELASSIGDTTQESSSQSASTNGSTLLDTSDMFSERDLEQEADLSEATYMTLESGEDITITEEGVYVIEGTAKDSSIIVEADDTAKVQLVLEGVNITNTDAPAIYIKCADKVFITTTDDNTLTVSGTFEADGDTNLDAVIYSKEDLVFNGTGSLTITSTGNGISGKDDIKFTGGSYTITSDEDAVEANDSIRISDGSFTIKSGKDALHSENADDDSVGFVYISGGDFDIDVEGDGIQATTVLTIDGGTIDINASEGMEATYVQINDGTINITATDDGINASNKSTQYDVVIEINGGNLTIDMGSGDTDALDVNGNLYINGGTIDITAQFAFDFDGEAKLTGGTVTVNGEEVTEITNSMMMGGGMGGNGGPGGQMPGDDQMPENGERPELPEGFDPENMPEMPEGFDPENMPQMPNGNMKGGRNGGH
ncbi:carbohydrate-binding domain-containing protein [Butyrivibrio sp. CB08]|uniref:carbohydrate-binding domain-containing protein n=1 Tax=Butyrivibrio sp. CB08 TaxID=2364879 RepID=UPI000EA9CF58|nr:carbohydrate-binding domain-containing protein [Butyrivibrio sp. CB08]RKM61405.1 carbohydrate-binding domain-containing protein [Butyrivibrio sp. CB08]